MSATTDNGGSSAAPTQYDCRAFSAGFPAATLIVSSKPRCLAFSIFTYGEGTKAPRPAMDRDNPSKGAIDHGLSLLIVVARSAGDVVATSFKSLV